MRLVSAELLKIRTAPRTTIGLLLGMLAIVTIGSLAASDTADDSEFGREIIVWDLLDVISAVAIFALILGILIVTWEYRHGTITQTFLAAPRREQVVAAKLAVGALAGAFLVILALPVALTIAWIWLGELDVRDEHWEQVGRLLAGCALWAILGAGLGALLQSQVGGLVVAFVWFFVVEPILGFRFEDLGDYLPGSALDGLLTTEPARGEPIDDGLSRAEAALVALGYAALLTAAGLVSALRRDVG